MENNQFEQNNVEIVTEETPVTPNSKNKIFGIPKHILLIAIAAVLVLAIAVPVGISVLTNTYKTPIKLEEKFNNKRQISNLYDEQIKTLNGFCEKECKAIFDILKKGEDFEDQMEDIQEMFEEAVEAQEDEYGSDYKISYEITDKYKLDKDELKEKRTEIKDCADDIKDLIEETEDFDSDDWEDMADELGISKSQAKKLVKEMENLRKELKDVEVTAGYELTVEKTITGSDMDEPEEEELTTYVYKVNGRWVSEDALFLVSRFRFVF